MPSVMFGPGSSANGAKGRNLGERGYFSFAGLYSSVRRGG